MIKIISGWSAEGGSTTAFINLTNLLNEYGLDTTFYGPHDYHLDKCKSGRMIELNINENDNIIIHFLKLQARPNCRKIILSVHEQNVFPLSGVDISFYDKLHFVAEHQKNYHKDWINGKEYFILSNVMDGLKPNPKKNKKSAGIIGSVDSNKNVHISIQRALRKGFKDIRIYGKITDPEYYRIKVEPIIKQFPNIIKYIGFCDDKQKMYDSLTDVFFSSEMECLPYVVGECKITNTNLHALEGKNYTNGTYEINRENIVNKWKEELCL